MHTLENSAPDDAGEDYMEARELVAHLTTQSSHDMTAKPEIAAPLPSEREVPGVQTPSDQETDRRKSFAVVFSHADVSQQLQLLATENGDTSLLSSDETARFSKLCWLTEQPARKALPFGTQQMREGLDELRRSCPPFIAVTDLVDRAVALSLLTESPLSLPPLLLVGPPGVGKTHYSKALAKVLGVAVYAWSCATNSDAMQLITGHPTSWRGARMGLMTEALVTSSSASPVFLLDEVDKFLTHRDEQPYHVLLNVLEAENAAALLDEYLRVRFDASHAIFIATANDVSALPTFIMDRFLIISVATPTGDALLAVTRQIAAKIITPLELPMPDDAVLAILARRNPRGITRMLRLALGFAAAESRKYLTLADVTAADVLASHEASRATIGFMRPRKGTGENRE